MKTTLKTILAAVAITCAAIPAHAFLPATGKDLLQLMNSPDKDDHLVAAGYVLGVWETGVSETACPKRDVGVEEIYNLTKRKLKEWPDLQHKLAATFIGAVVRNEWPCRK